MTVGVDEPPNLPKRNSKAGKRIRMLLVKGCMSPQSLRTFELSSSLGKESWLVFSCFETMLAELTYSSFSFSRWISSTPIHFHLIFLLAVVRKNIY
uniref:Uncharacterized protein n=1 Tax=Populus trichocarpa TaxID=3694 RepID=B9IM42_POPTR